MWYNYLWQVNLGLCCKKVINIATLFLKNDIGCTIIVGRGERMKTYKFINLPPRELKPWVIARADDKWMEDMTSDLNNQLQDGWELFQVVYAGNRFIAVLTK